MGVKGVFKDNRTTVVLMSCALSICLSIHPSVPPSPLPSFLDLSSCLCHSFIIHLCEASASPHYRGAEWWMEGVSVLVDEWRMKVFFIYPLPVIPSHQAFHMLYLPAPLRLSPSPLSSPLLTCTLSLYCSGVKRWACSAPSILAGTYSATSHRSGFHMDSQPTPVAL